MIIGKLYQSNEFNFLLYSTKEIVLQANAISITEPNDLSYWNFYYASNMSLISPNDIFCLLEKDGKYLKVLSSNGESGWIYLANWLEMHIQEVKQ